MKEYGRKRSLRERILWGPEERQESKVQVMLFVVFFNLNYFLWLYSLVID